jgi:hypothetical protein
MEEQKISFSSTTGSTETLPFSPQVWATAARANVKSIIAWTRRSGCSARTRRSRSTP